MIKVENIEVFGWEAAIRGMRNPMNSWNKSDSEFGIEVEEDTYNQNYITNVINDIGPNDLKLMQSLVKAGTDHSKFMRMINVTMDITAPLYWYKEWDTYKVGTVANSCSTMHKIAAKEFTLEDFSCEHLMNMEEQDVWAFYSSNVSEIFNFKGVMKDIITGLNNARQLYLETKDKKYWWQLIQLLPSSYNQKRTVQLNYQVLRHMYFSRKNHKLDEWVEFCKIIETLPYAKELIIPEV